MATGRNIFDGLNNASKAGVRTAPSARFRTRDVALSAIYRNEANLYSLDDVDKLAKDILLAGRLYHNLVLVYDPTPKGEYRLISGERRWLALQQLVREGHEEFATVTAQILPKSTPEQEQLAIILANAQREKTAADRVQEYEGIKSALEEMRSKGQDLYGRDLSSGRLRDVIAEITEEAAGTLATLEKISTRLIPELRQLMDQGRLGYMAAADAANLTADQQLALVSQASMDEAAQMPITRKDVKVQAEAARAEVAAKYAGMTCPMHPAGTCSNAEQLAGFYRDGATSGCPGCCAACEKADQCQSCCAEVKAKLHKAEPEEPEEFEQTNFCPAEEEQPMRMPETGVPTEVAAESFKKLGEALAAHPRHAESKCYHCAHWNDCTERSDRVLTCDKYESTQKKQTAEVVSTVDTTQTIRDDSELIELLRRYGGMLMAVNGLISQKEKDRLQELLSGMWELWENETI